MKRDPVKERKMCDALRTATAPWRPSCPVCGVKGYRRIRRLHDDGTLVFVCRAGHPHYLPESTQQRVWAFKTRWKDRS